MILSHCPNCQYDNAPGERFCASCGVPLDLKPCARCGKVDSVTATVCSGCGAAFPPIGTSGGDVATGVRIAGSEWGQGEKPAGIPSPVAPPAHAIGPLPLIVVAVVAGGIPLLWMYRNSMPQPKAWQPQGQVVTSGVAVSPPLLPVAPAAAPAVPAAAPAAEKPVPAAPAATEEPVPAAQTMAEPAPEPKPKPAAASKPAAKPRPAAKEPQSSARACPEALSAVGLCDPAAAKK